MDPAGRWLKERLGCTLTDAGLLQRALTHRSFGADNNERLEYLGDAVLSFLVAELLYRNFPDAAEGELSRYRATLVSGDALARIASEIDLGSHIRLGDGEMKSGGQRRGTILADALEAVCGAIYLDRGLEAAREVAVRLFDGPLSALPTYTVLEVSGDPHEQQFRVRCDVGELSLSAVADGSSRRRAEQEAALRVLESPSLQTPR